MLRAFLYRVVRASICFKTLSAFKSVNPVCLFVPLVFLLYSLNSSLVHADQQSYWPSGRKAAVVLSYDDALSSHVDVVLPLLNQHKLKATFYLTGNRSEVTERMENWRDAAALGHELGNHSLVHPCIKSIPGRDWVRKWQALERYTKAQYVSELRLTNTLLQALDGQQHRTYAYPCSELQVEGESAEDLVEPLFVASRHAGDSGLYQPNGEGSQWRSLHTLPAYDGAGKSGHELINAVKAALPSQSLIIFVFHGVGGEYLDVDEKAHRELIEFLSSNTEVYWVTTMLGAAKYMLNSAEYDVKE